MIRIHERFSNSTEQFDNLYANQRDKNFRRYSQTVETESNVTTLTAVPIVFAVLQVTTAGTIGEV